MGGYCEQTNFEGCERKQLCPILRYYVRIFLEEPQNALVWIVNRGKNGTNDITCNLCYF
jgi:hypothetical protein